MFQCVLCKSLSQSIYSAIGIILLLYEYSQKISAHSQHYQTSKSCDIDDLDNNLMYYCTYLYALSQYNQTINSSKTSPPQPYSLQDKQSCLQWFDAQFLQTINTRWWAMNKKQIPYLQRNGTARIFLMKCCSWNNGENNYIAVCRQNKQQQQYSSSFTSCISCTTSSKKP